MKHGIICSVLFVLCTQALCDVVFEDFETIDGWKKFGRHPVKFEMTSDAVEGKGALKMTVPGMVIKRYKADQEKRQDWNEKLKGLAFRVKGDGSDNWASIAVAGPGWSFRYYFPVKDTNWRKIVVPWSEFIPENHITQKINTFGALPTSGLSTILIGDNWNITHRNKKIKPYSYCVDQIELVEDLGDAKPVDTSSLEPAPYDEVVKKMKNGEEVTIYCLGDSITAGTGLFKPNDERYAVLLQKKLREHFKNDKITVQSRAVGGARANHATAWIERDFSDKIPDLVTFMIGYNNKSGAHSPALYREMLNNYIDQVVAKSKGKTAILLITTTPGKDYRFNMQDDYAQVVREVAPERGLPYCDVAAAFKKLGPQGIGDYLRDTAHPNDKGHKLFADTLFNHIIEEEKKTKRGSHGWFYFF